MEFNKYTTISIIWIITGIIIAIGLWTTKNPFCLLALLGSFITTMLILDIQ